MQSGSHSCVTAGFVFRNEEAKEHNGTIRVVSDMCIQCSALSNGIILRLNKRPAPAFLVVGVFTTAVAMKRRVAARNPDCSQDQKSV
jgi:hypothetical protein